LFLLTIISGMSEDRPLSRPIVTIYVIDLSSGVPGRMDIFSHDAVIYREISDNTDAGILSSDTNNDN
jgi:hypothetical protein